MTGTGYRIPEGVSARTLAGRPLLRTPEGGWVAIDDALLSLWQLANGKELEQIVRSYPDGAANPALTRAALAALVAAGLLGSASGEAVGRDDADAPSTGGLVSAIIVTYNSAEWLAECLGSLARQTCSPVEVIVVDNASTDDSVERARASAPEAKVLALQESRSLARAINVGAAAATGDYLLLLNPDVKLDTGAVAQMVKVAASDPGCAAVASNLRFAWAPAFLNGLGNRVASTSWGTDNCIGSLDLGQFDGWREVPSACFAATLIPRAAWNAVGPVDEGFPLYYEDAEWCYRARLLGHAIRLAPLARASHAFGSSVPDGTETELAPRKLGRVAYGRLRFAARLLGGDSARQFVANYLREDRAGLRRALASGNWRVVRAYLGTWRDFAKDWPGLRRAQHDLERRRAISDERLISPLRDYPPARIWRGLPELTLPLVEDYYLPILSNGWSPKDG